MYRRGIATLASLLFFLQAYFICTSSSWTAYAPLVAQPLISIVLLVASAAIDISIVRYVLRAVDQTTRVYARDMDTELNRMLDRYEAETTKARQRSKEVASAVESELAQARVALSKGDFAATNAHMQDGLSRTLDATPPPCDNPVIAAVITGKTQECQDSGIALAAHLRVARDLPLPETDVVAIIFNLIDNARHECEALLADGSIESPEVTVRIWPFSSQLFIEVENPSRTGVRHPGRTIGRSPFQTGSHGLGTGIVSSLARQHGGIAEFNAHDGSFVAQVMLPLEQDGSV